MTDARTRSLSRHLAASDLSHTAASLIARRRSEESTTLWVPCGSKPEDHPVSALGGKCPACHGSGRRTLTWQERWELAAYAGDSVCVSLAGEQKPPECQSCYLNRENAEIDDIAADLWAEWDGNPAEDYKEEDDRDDGFDDMDPGPCTCGSLQLWLSGLSRWGVLLRAACLAARVALEAMIEKSSSRCRGDCDGGCETWYARRAIVAAETWLLDPTGANREAWWEAWVPVDGTDAAHWVPAPLVGSLPERLCQDVQAADRLAPPGAVREAIQAGLIEWAVG